VAAIIPLEPLKDGKPALLQLCWFLLGPILDHKPLYPGEFTTIRCYQNQIPAERLSGDQGVIFADALALAFEFSSNLSSGLCIPC
jgi:hypothetical protein